MLRTQTFKINYKFLCSTSNYFCSRGQGNVELSVKRTIYIKLKKQDYRKRKRKQKIEIKEQRFKVRKDHKGSGYEK